jgi:hypothetical protein
MEAAASLPLFDIDIDSPSSVQTLQSVMTRWNGRGL